MKIGLALFLLPLRLILVYGATATHQERSRGYDEEFHNKIQHRRAKKCKNAKKKAKKAASRTKTVFLTSELFTGNLGGLTGADDKCQNLAENAGLDGTFKAWLSDSKESPNTRFVHSTVPYVLVDGTVVALDWDDMQWEPGDGGGNHYAEGGLVLRNLINRDEYGDFVDGLYGGQSNWTGSDMYGNPVPYESGLDFKCDDWTSVDPEKRGENGLWRDSLVGLWSGRTEHLMEGPYGYGPYGYALRASCDDENRLLCFQQ